MAVVTAMVREGLGRADVRTAAHVAAWRQSSGTTVLINVVCTVLQGTATVVVINVETGGGILPPYVEAAGSPGTVSTSVAAVQRVSYDTVAVGQVKLT